VERLAVEARPAAGGELLEQGALLTALGLEGEVGADDGVADERQRSTGIVGIVGHRESLRGADGRRG
jgi:hypothetical protein